LACREQREESRAVPPLPLRAEIPHPLPFSPKGKGI
jgi:hypothetical protein